MYKLKHLRKEYKMKTVTETAKVFGVTRQTVLNWINKGIITASQPYKEYRIEETEIERLKNKTKGV